MESTNKESDLRPSAPANSDAVSSHWRTSLAFLREMPLMSPASHFSISKTCAPERRCHYFTIVPPVIPPTWTEVTVRPSWVSSPTRPTISSFGGRSDLIWPQTSIDDILWPSLKLLPLWQSGGWGNHPEADSTLEKACRMKVSTIWALCSLVKASFSSSSSLISFTLISCVMPVTPRRRCLTNSTRLLSSSKNSTWTCKQGASVD